MTSIFDCEEYIGARYLPIIETNARYGRPADTVVFYYAYTRTGRVSKHWWAHRMNYALHNKQALHRRCLKEHRPDLRGRLKGYRWSKAYLYSGDPKEWEGYEEC